MLDKLRFRDMVGEGVDVDVCWNIGGGGGIVFGLTLTLVWR